VVDDRARIQTNDDPPDSKRHRLELHRFEVEHIDLLAGHRGVVYLHQRDRWRPDRPALAHHAWLFAEMR